MEQLMKEENSQRSPSGEAKKRKVRKQEYGGSRWVAVGLLVVTVVLSLAFYLGGQLRKRGLSIPRFNKNGSSQINEGGGGEATWMFEK
jgi:hypothetical protein